MFLKCYKSATVRKFQWIVCALLGGMTLVSINAYCDPLTISASTQITYTAERQNSVFSDQGQTISDKQIQFRTNNIIASTVWIVGFYGSKYWWKDGLTSDFHVIDEGWFGENTYAGGADKLGHVYTAYVGTRLLTKAFVWAGNTPDAALGLSTKTILGTMLGIEILDGFSKAFSFSKEDAIADLVGATLGYHLEKNPELDKLLDFRVHYWPSEEAKSLGEYDPIEDSSGQTYILALKAKGIPFLRKYALARYLELAIGYGSRGYQPGNGSFERSRHLYFGISLNMSEVLSRTVFRNNQTPGRMQRITDTTLKYIQLPGTVLGADHKL